MMTATDRQRRADRFTRAAALCLLALAAALLQAREARAQWTTSGNVTSTTNNVGVGTNAPSATLEVQGPDGTLTLSQAGVPGKANIQAAIGTDLHMSANARWTANSWARNDASIPSWNFFLAPSAGADFAGVRRAAPSAGAFAWTDIMRITANGNVGIGTTAPTDRLEVNGNITNGAGLTISTAGTTKYRTGSLGTTVPNWGGQLMNVRFNEASGNWTLDDTSLNAGFIKLDLRTFSQGNEIAVYRMPAGANPRPDSAWTPIAQFKLDTGNVLLAASSGNVGIGTAAPASKLHVVGDITVTGNINAKYQDVAEWVPTTQKLSAGTVVVVDAAGQNRVLASAKSYDTGVAGVITGRPGLVLGEGGEGKVMVATTGRVKVKVDATRAPVCAGDLLVTSDVPGVAMKSVPVELGGVTLHRPGTIIGKALEPLEKGAGEILVLLSLQ